MIVEKLIQGNQEFVKTFKKEEELYQELAHHGQHPKVLWIGCSDSRVVPEFIVNADAGDLFVLRNIANIIPPCNANDLSSSSVLEYAVLELKVEHIVVCGHTGCGGITELVKGTPNNSRVSEWLKYASQKRAANDANPDSYILQSIKDNILLQSEHLLTFDFIKENSHNLSIHKWLYDMHSGDISYYDDKESIWIKLEK
jgi:carbonic anhydrase